MHGYTNTMRNVIFYVIKKCNRLHGRKYRLYYTVNHHSITYITITKNVQDALIKTNPLEKNCAFQ